MVSSLKCLLSFCIDESLIYDDRKRTMKLKTGHFTNPSSQKMVADHNKNWRPVVSNRDLLRPPPGGGGGPGPSTCSHRKNKAPGDSGRFQETAGGGIGDTKKTIGGPNPPCSTLLFNYFSNFIAFMESMGPGKSPPKRTNNF